MAQQKRKPAGNAAEAQRRMVFDQMLAGKKVFLTNEGKVFLRGDKVIRPTEAGGMAIKYEAAKKREVIS